MICCHVSSAYITSRTSEIQLALFPSRRFGALLANGAVGGKCNLAAWFGGGGCGGDDDVDQDGCDQEETSKFETHVKPLPTEWMDEKHSLYLKSMEASFVDQLYNSMGFPGFESSRKASTETKSHYLVASEPQQGRGGSWQKIIVGKGEVQLDGHHSSRALLSNQWIRHHRHLEREWLVESNVPHGKAKAIDQEMNSPGKASLPYRFRRSLKISHSVPSNPQCPAFTNDDTEASGQNFTNEDIMEEKCSTLCSSGRVRSQAPGNDSSRNDQFLEVA